MTNRENTSTPSTNSEHSTIQVTNKIRKCPYEKSQEKRQSKLISMIASQLPNFPFLVEELLKNKEYALDISKEMAK